MFDQFQPYRTMLKYAQNHTINLLPELYTLTPRRFSSPKISIANPPLIYYRFAVLVNPIPRTHIVDIILILGVKTTLLTVLILAVLVATVAIHSYFSATSSSQNFLKNWCNLPPISGSDFISNDGVYWVTEDNFANWHYWFGALWLWFLCEYIAPSCTCISIRSLILPAALFNSRAALARTLASPEYSLVVNSVKHSGYRWLAKHPELRATLARTNATQIRAFSSMLRHCSIRPGCVLFGHSSTYRPFLPQYRHLRLVDLTDSPVYFQTLIGYGIPAIVKNLAVAASRLQDTGIVLRLKRKYGLLRQNHAAATVPQCFHIPLRIGSFWRLVQIATVCTMFSVLILCVEMMAR